MVHFTLNLISITFYTISATLPIEIKKWKILFFSLLILFLNNIRINLINKIWTDYIYLIIFYLEDNNYNTSNVSTIPLLSIGATRLKILEVLSPN